VTVELPTLPTGSGSTIETAGPLYITSASRSLTSGSNFTNIYLDVTYTGVIQTFNAPGGLDVSKEDPKNPRVPNKGTPPQIHTVIMYFICQFLNSAK
jgi:hypothetical protein